MYLMQKQVKSRIVSLYQDFEYLLENEKLMESEKWHTGTF